MSSITKAEVYDAIFIYGLDFREPEFTDDFARSLFTLIKPQIDANIKRYNNGNKPKVKQDKSEPEAKQKQKVSKNEANENDNVNDNEVYRRFAHLSMSKDEYIKLLTDYTESQVNNVLDEIENYKGNKNYKSLYLTAKKWLQKNYPKQPDKIPFEELDPLVRKAIELGYEKY